MKKFIIFTLFLVFLSFTSGTSNTKNEASFNFLETEYVEETYNRVDTIILKIRDKPKISLTVTR